MTSPPASKPVIAIAENHRQKVVKIAQELLLDEEDQASHHARADRGENRPRPRA